METIDIEAIQQELQKHGLDRLEPNDPLFMDYLARRLELQWHYEKIANLLNEQQNQISLTNREFSESLRNAYTQWINEGAEHIENTITEVLNRKVNTFQNIPNTIKNNETQKNQSRLLYLATIIASLLLGILIGQWRF